MKYQVLNIKTNTVIETGLSRTQANKKANALNSVSGKQTLSRPFRAVPQ
jgi:hypothetical protein